MTDAFDTTIADLKSVTQQVLGNRPDFEAIWQQTVDEFKTWAAGLPAAISPLTQNQEFVRRLCVNFGDESIRDNENVQNVVLNGAVDVGQTLELRGGKYEVIGRTLSSRGGVLYRLRDEHGDVMKHEFFD